jgi:hypothetical protein
MLAYFRSDGHKTALLGSRTRIFSVAMGGLNWLVHSAKGVVARRNHWAQTILWKLPQGFQFSFIGLFFVAIFPTHTVKTSHNQWTCSDMVAE